MVRTLICIALGSLIAQSSSAQLSSQSAARFGLFPRGEHGPLRLVRYDVDVRIDHPVAATTVTQEFLNPTRRNLEAYYYYPVPPTATVHDLVLWVAGKPRRARIMERQKAREIYQRIVSRQKDPAIVERLAGNLFRIRIFPVLAKSITRIQLRFAQPVVDAEHRWRRLTLRHPNESPQILRLSATVSASGGLLGPPTLRGFPGEFVADTIFGQRGYRLARNAAQRAFSRDVVIAYGVRDAPHFAGAKHAQRALIVAELPVAEATQHSTQRLMLLVDRSRSMRPYLMTAHRLVELLRQRLTPADRVALVEFDLLPEQCRWLAIADRSLDNQLERLTATATDKGLGTAFVPVIEQALSERRAHAVLITDGGDDYHRVDLDRALRLIHDRPGTRFSVVHLGTARGNEQRLQDIARLSGGHYLQLAQPSSLTIAKVETLLSSTSPVRVFADGQPLQVIARGAKQIIVTGALTPGATLSLAHDAELNAIGPAPAADRDVAGVPAVYASAAIDQLMNEIKLFGETPRLVDQIVELSLAHRVVSDYTALLATENDAQYELPTSGRRWQRRAAPRPSTANGSYHATPEPHEWALMLLALAALVYARRSGWLVFPR